MVDEELVDKAELEAGVVIVTGNSVEMSVRVVVAVVVDGVENCTVVELGTDVDTGWDPPRNPNRLTAGGG